MNDRLLPVAPMSDAPAASHFLARLMPYLTPPRLTLFILIVAAGVRFWRLDFHSFWFDEAVSLRWASAEIAFIWEKTFPLVEEKHPPAYYIALHLWLGLLEWFDLHQADAPIRSLGALLGVLTTWASLRLATRLSGAGVGALTGLLVALSPLLVWYSQEARMFQPATTGIVWAGLALYSAWHTANGARRLAWWLCLIAALLFALYNYLFSAFIMPAVGLSLLLLFRAQPNRRRLLEGMLALTLVTLLFLPLAQNAWGVNAAESTPGRAFENFWDNHVGLLEVFTVWRVRWPDLLVNAALLLWGSLLLIGLLPRAQPSRTSHPSRRFSPSQNLDAYWLWLWLGLPLLIANLLLSRSGSIFTEDRYLLFVAPFALWAAARGVGLLTQRLPAVGILAGALTVLSLAAALPQIWSPANYRENWRAAAQYIIDYSHATPELTAAGVAHIDYTNLPLQWYLRQAFGHDDLPVFFPFGGWIDPENTEENVAPYIRGIEDLDVDTLWLSQAHLQHVDPTGAVEGWVQSTYPIITELFPTGIKLTGHALKREYSTLPVAANAAPLEVAPGLFLHSCAPVFAQVAAQDAVYHPPSGWVHIQSWWSRAPVNGETEANGEADSTLTDYTLHARVLGPNAIWGESLARPADTFALHPPRTWTPDAFIRAELDINLNPITPGGNYAIEVRLEGTDGTHTAPCGTVEILS
ncbi:MAG: glycosyltransferase family 39 protein [Litorilinea sp.]